MIKWFWYATAAITLIAVLVLIVGLGQLSSLGPDTSGTDDSKSGVDGQGSSDGIDSSSDSALVAAVKRYSKRWEPPRGSLQVSIEPSEVMSKQPKWRANQGAWQESGTILEKLLVSDTYAVEFQDVEGWIKPKAQAAKLKKNQVSRLTGTYRLPPPMGSLMVAIYPPEAVQAKMRWQYDGKGWQNHGAKVPVSVGQHKVTFTSFSGWHTPTVITVDIQKDQCTAIAGTYIEKPKGSLQVAIEPNEIHSQAKWRYAKNTWQPNGTTVEKILVGSYPLEFNGIAGWYTPEKITIAIEPNELTQVLAIYEEKPKGGICVTLLPDAVVEAKAQWKLDTGPWQDSGVTLNGILTGSHTVSVKPVKGWTAPKSYSIDILEGQVEHAELVYTIPPPPPPPAPEFQLKATLIVGSRSVAWIQHPKQTKPEIYFLEEEVAQYKISEIHDGYINLVCQGHTFKLAVPEPTPTDQLKPSIPSKPTPKKTVAPKRASKKSQPPARPMTVQERRRKIEEQKARRGRK